MKYLLLAALAIMLTSCGGSGGGSTPVPTPDPDPVPLTHVWGDQWGTLEWSGVPAASN